MAQKVYESLEIIQWLYAVYLGKLILTHTLFLLVILGERRYIFSMLVTNLAVQRSQQRLAR